MSKQKIFFRMDEYSEQVDHKWLIDNLVAGGSDKYYTPPIDYTTLAKALRANTTHEAALRAKRNISITTLKPTNFIKTQLFSQMLFEYLVFGNAYLLVIRNKLNQVMRLEYIPAKYTRVGKITKAQPSQSYYFINSLGISNKIQGEVIHLKEHDFNQTIYGVPEYLSAIPGIFLSESATIFRRRYYENGSHAGFIMHITADLDEDAVKEIKNRMKDTRGKGNFKNILLYDPGGSAEGVTLTPISEIKAKDEFETIKNACRDDILTAHRVPPQLMSIIPQNTSGLGDIEKSAKIFAKNELGPLQLKLQEINNQLHINALIFKDYKLDD